MESTKIYVLADPQNRNKCVNIARVLRRAVSDYVKVVNQILIVDKGGVILVEGIGAVRCDDDERAIEELILLLSMASKRVYPHMSIAVSARIE